MIWFAGNICIFYTGAYLDNLMPYNLMWCKILKLNVQVDIGVLLEYMESVSPEDGKCTTQRVRSLD